MKIPTEMLLWLYLTLAKTFSDVRVLKFLGGFYPQEESYFPFQKEQKQFFGFTTYDRHKCFYMICGIKEHLNLNPATHKLNKVVLFRLYQPLLTLLLLCFLRQSKMHQTPVTENFPLIHHLQPFCFSASAKPPDVFPPFYLPALFRPRDRISGEDQRERETRQDPTRHTSHLMCVK